MTRASRPTCRIANIFLYKILSVSAIAVLVTSAHGGPPAGTEAAREKSAKTTGASAEKSVLWREPTDIGLRDLRYGEGGAGHAPTTTVFAFIKEDLSGSNPKLIVTDRDGVKWKIKLGAEVKPEVAASRLVWAVGYFTNEN